MEFNEYQEATRRTDNSKLPFNQHAAMLIMGISGEAGEIVDIWKKHLFHGHEAPDLEKIMEETSDLIWYIARLLDLCEISMGDAAQFNIDKLMERYPEGFSEEASRNRKKRK